MQVDITSHNVQKLQLATKVDEAGDLIVKISAESKIHPADVARLLYLQKNKAPLYFSVGSMQATMDLEMVTIKSEKVEKPATPAPAAATTTPAEKEAKLITCPECLGSGVSKKKPLSPCELCKGSKTILERDIKPEDIFKATEPITAATPSGNGNDGPAPKRRRSKKTAAAPETTPV